jgi:hypothetical protein
VIVLAFIATFAIAFVLGAACGVWLDNTQRVKPIDIGLGKVLVATTADPTEVCLVEPYTRNTSGVLGQSRNVDMAAGECGVLLARIRMANADGAWVFQRAIERAVEAAALKEDGGAA